MTDLLKIGAAVMFWAIPCGGVFAVWLLGPAAGAAFVVGAFVGAGLLLAVCAGTAATGLFEARKGDEPIDETFMRMLARMPDAQARACVERLARAEATGEALREAALGRVS